jgi:uncharacterized protein (DUF2147 family)
MKMLIAAVAICIASISAHTPDANDIVGVWKPGEGTSHIRIFKQKDKDLYFGKVIWLKQPLDESGKPKLDKKGNAILEMVNLRDFKFKDDSWTNGTIYDPTSGNTYYCTIEMKEKDVLHVRGSVDRWGLIGRTDTWTRVK